MLNKLIENGYSENEIEKLIEDECIYGYDTVVDFIECEPNHEMIILDDNGKVHFENTVEGMKNSPLFIFEENGSIIGIDLK